MKINIGKSAYVFPIFTARKRSLGQGNVFMGVFLSTVGAVWWKGMKERVVLWKGVWWKWMWWRGCGTHTTSSFGPKGRHPPWGKHPPVPRGTPLDPEADTPNPEAGTPLVETSTEAGGTHPTGMLSCCKFYSKSHEKVRHKFQNNTFMANKLFLFLSSASRKSPFYSGGYYKKIYHHKRWVSNLLWH